ncbi:helicase-like transcription factor CHR28 isoform X1 [Iris pallida]|uniref:Helicase-like transcription factor CHR28 isoform X1 n=1 Tax=Iris pallida TaxID=29817 RepID=A0AAX6EEY9_IRIPA|nr:helicase-like transcription factor CHR28 isoform X1 [Iris pallida]KAJ6827363.1 helicase-like transcription factor CHR28 isoform X1 [Iris pallida]
MMGAGAMDGSSPMAFDSDPLGSVGGDDFLDNLSISVDNIFAILEEEPDPDPHPLLLHCGNNNGILPGTSEGFDIGELAPGHVDHAKAFKPKAEPSSVLGDFIEHPQWTLEDSDSKREMDFDFLFEPEVGFNNFIDNGSFPASQHFDSKSSHPLPLQQTSDCLTPSYSNNNDLMGAFGGPSGSYFSNNIDHQQMLNNIPQCGGIRSTKAVGLTSPNNNNNGFYISEMERKLDHEKQRGEIYFQSEEESRLDVNKLSSLCNLQNGDTGSSHRGLVKNSIFCGDLHSSRSAGVSLISTVEDGNTLRYLCSHMNTDAPLTDQVHIEANTFQLANMTCDGSNSLTVPRESPTGVEFVTDQMKLAHFHSLLSCGYESTDAKGNQLVCPNSYRTSEEVKLGAEGSPDSSFPEVSIIDLDASLPDEDQDYSEDLSLISESSTDSSPIPSSRNFGSVSADSRAVNSSKKLPSDPKIILSSKNPKSEIQNERGDQLVASSYKHHDVPKVGNPTVLRNLRRGNFGTEDDSDVCILDHISDPAIPAGLLAQKKPLPISQYSGFRDRHSGMGSLRLKPEDERSTFQIALQDLSQPISEASPPDGVLAVPLLRHQRIALSWMVNKETANLRCSGGILADDQGLGKTISTIALILMERSPSCKSCSMLEKQEECEALNLDDDEVSVMKQSRHSMPQVMSRPIRENPVSVVKGRPQAGTLVVCPTSVLRQWAEELQNKVTSKANLSYLVYHGGNRTKDPNELAKYDVVLTTYAIVSMEVPKQPLVDKDDEDRGKQEASCVLDDPLSSKKRKKCNSKSRNSISHESGARPLARVGWFRVVLDEAQSIKNHRTQVARACWGLRAKRRWCLSGTPIQNAIDDLYSYFRFLRFEQLEKYHSFCSSIKVPINKDPPNGYKRLRAVLKMIMLRRTKGTLLDGKPIINLPPKTVSLKKVKFSNEERNFYMTLEAESQEQFKVYADAGTVKQNYVNILLMLLRLRQACDHHLLVKGCGSVSNRNSSLETAKKLSRDKKINLLSCLEASLAICTICNDAPEDSVVTICGHVFCNQCICEHLNGDEHICPSPNCKVQLSVASFFSRGTLISSLSDQLGHDSDSPGFEAKDEHDTCEDGPAYPLSSKLKAALEILQSLPKYQGSLKSNSEKASGGLQDSLVNSLNTDPLRTSVDSSGVEHMSLDKCSGSIVSEKAIVFSQWTGMLDLLEIPLRASSIQYRRLDGTMSVAARERAIKDFNTLPEVTVMIMSLKAASLGLNMVAACHVLLLDLWWNPTTEDQAIDRAHRIGQTRPVTVSRLTVEHTVEDRILRLQQKKREMVSSAFGEDDSGTRQTRLTEDDLRYLFMV